MDCGRAAMLGSHEKGEVVNRTRSIRYAGITLAAGLLVAGCSSSGSDAGGDGGDAGAATGTIQVWRTQGQQAEQDSTQRTIDGFNESQSDITAELTFIPEGTYEQSLTTTSCDALPDVFMVDGSSIAATVYAGKLRELSDVVSAETISSQIASVQAQNTYDDGIYAVAQFDSGLALYGNKSMLEAANVDYPTTVADAWTFEEFAAAVEALANEAKGGKGLDIKENYGGTWPGYAFTPIVNSVGFPLVKDNSADGQLNAPEVAAALTEFAKLRKFTDANADDKAFQSERVGLSWVGHWVYNDYKDALGDDLVVIPLPDFGMGTKSGQGSSAWGISACSGSAAAAGVFLDYLMTDPEVTDMTDGNAAPPGTTSVTESSALYQAGGPLELYAEQLKLTCGAESIPTADCVTVPRTISPAWPIINTEFSKAFFDIWGGGDAQSSLDTAVKLIDLDYSDNANYE